MEMTFDDYISAPMGKNNAVISHREMYRNLYKDKLDAILLRERGKVKYELYTSKNKFYVHMHVPSEVVPEFYYDTVIEFYTDNSAYKTSRTISNYNVRFYSNDPSFVYTFAYSMLKNKMFIKDLVPRMSKQAVKNAAKERNPKNTLGYVKSIYFTYLLMKKYGLFNKINFKAYGKKYNQKVLLKNIVHADTKIKNRQIEAEKISAKKKSEKKKAKRKKTQNTKSITTNNNTKVAKTTKRISASNTNRSKTAKRI